MEAGFRLDDASIEAIAQRVVELLRESDASSEMLNTAEVARRFNVSCDWGGTWGDTPDSHPP